jgi:hypothetical protein
MGWRRVYNGYFDRAEKKQRKIISQIKSVGELDQDILDNWMFWRVIKKDFNLFVYRDELSYPDIQILNAIMDMDEDTEKTYNQYFFEQSEKITNRS